MTPIRQAVVLAAGEGSRLRDRAPYKPLCPVAGRPLIDHALEGLATAGIARAIVVTGYGAGAIEDHLASRDWPLTVESVRTADWRLPNGVSAASAADAAGGTDALLLMADHLVEPAIYARMASHGAGRGLTLGIDRRLDHPWVDPIDVTRVATDRGRIVAIGKGLERYDANDTGVFAVSSDFLRMLGEMEAPSLSQGVALLAAEGRAGTVDVSGLAWLDVDDGIALAQAEAWLATGAQLSR